MPAEATPAAPAATSNPLAGGPVGVIMPTWLGDIVMSEPALRRLAAADGTGPILAMTPPALVDVAATIPAVSDVVGVHGKGFTGPAATASALRRAGAASVLILPNSPRSALAARLSGRPVRAGFATGGRAPLLTHRVPKPGGRGPRPTSLDYDHLVAHLLGSDAAPPAADDDAPLVGPRPHLAVPDAARHAAAAAIDAHIAGRATGAHAGPPRLAILVPGGVRAAKRWPPERFAAIARILADDHGLVPVITGSPAEREICAAIAADAGPSAVDLAAAGTGLDALIGLIADATLVVSNDTGPRHLAVGFGTPCVSLFGPTDPRWTRLDGANERVLAAEPFLPPDRVSDDHADFCRIDRIPTGDVRHAVARILEERSVETPA